MSKTEPLLTKFRVDSSDMTKSLDKRYKNYIKTHETIFDAYESNEKDIHLLETFDYVSSILDIIGPKFFKQLFLILLFSSISVIIPIIVNSFKTLKECPSGEQSDMDDYTLSEIESFTKQDSLNWILIVFVRIYQSVLSVIGFLWFYPTVLYLNQENWLQFRVFAIIYTVFIYCVIYFLLYLNSSIGIPQNYFAFFETLTEIILVIILAILYGYNIIRILSPMLVWNVYMVLFGFVLYNLIVNKLKQIDTLLFALLYPFLITLYESIGLLFINGYFCTLPSKQFLIKTCNNNNKLIIWPWFCCCSDIPCVTNRTSIIDKLNFNFPFYCNDGNISMNGNNIHFTFKDAIDEMEKEKEKETCTTPNGKSNNDDDNNDNNGNNSNKNGHGITTIVVENFKFNHEKHGMTRNVRNARSIDESMSSGSFTVTQSSQTDVEAQGSAIKLQPVTAENRDDNQESNFDDSNDNNGNNGNNNDNNDKTAEYHHDVTNHVETNQLTDSLDAYGYESSFSINIDDAIDNGWNNITSNEKKLKINSESPSLSSSNTLLPVQTQSESVLIEKLQARQLQSKLFSNGVDIALDDDHGNVKLNNTNRTVKSASVNNLMVPKTSTQVQFSNDIIVSSSGHDSSNLSLDLSDANKRNSSKIAQSLLSQMLRAEDLDRVKTISLVFFLSTCILTSCNPHKLCLIFSIAIASWGHQSDMVTNKEERWVILQQNFQKIILVIEDFGV